MLAQGYNPSTWDLKTGGSEVRAHPQYTARVFICFWCMSEYVMSVGVVCVGVCACVHQGGQKKTLGVLLSGLHLIPLK